MSEIITIAWAAYLSKLNCHPLPTKAITAGCLTGLSDVIAQMISGSKHIQIKRLILMMLTGVAYMGPFDHFVQKFLENNFKGKNKETIAKKVFMQEFIISPMNTMLFFTFYGKVVEGKPFSAVTNKIMSDYPSIQFTSWKFWPLVSWMNHQFVPPHLRVLLMNIIGVGWGVFLNLKARSVVPLKLA